MKIAILGYAGQGQSAYEYWHKSGNEITICDQNTDVSLPEGTQSRLGDNYLDRLDEFDLLVRTPALHPRDIVAANPDSPNILEKVTTVTNEFFKICPTKNIIGITGTKGKGTTSTLVAKMLEVAGKTVYLGGNIGTPPLDLLKNNIQPEDWVVLELANFQLIDLKYSPPIAVCLMVESEHMDWHTSMDEYIQAKQQLFVHQTSDNAAIYYAKNDNSKTVASVSPARLVPYFAPPGATVENSDILIDNQSVCKTDELKLLGQHNWQNVCAAVTAVWQVTQDVSAMRSVLTSFTGLEHRLEFIKEVDGVKYYDDSFGTTPETAIVAIQAFKDPLILILGGSSKGSRFNELAQVVKENDVRQVILIGNTSNPQYHTATPEIEAALKAVGVNNITSLVRPGGSKMGEIIQTARQAAKEGDVVLLSTACASFDMFKNYQDRGQQFKLAVQVLV